MKYRVAFALLWMSRIVCAAELEHLPPITTALLEAPKSDWLLRGDDFKSGAYRSGDGKELIVSNGLVARTFRLAPNAATVGIDNLVTGETLLRNVRPEAVIVIDGKSIPVGGLVGKAIQNYLKPEWIDGMKADPEALRFISFDVSPIEARLAWKPRANWISGSTAWPPRGIHLALHFAEGAGGLVGVAVDVHYELYDGMPLVSKWIVVKNLSQRAIRLNLFKAEILAAAEAESSVEANPRWELPNMHVETDMSFAGMDVKGASPAARWLPDPAYQTQVHVNLKTPCLLECSPPLGPEIDLAPQQSFESFRIYELPHGSTERERKGLESRQIYRVISPWVTENPLIFHAASSKPQAVRRAIDEAAEVGFELIIMTFGSGFNPENDDASYIQQMKELADYAHSKGIGLGGYSLLASRSIDPENDVVNPKTGKPGGFARFDNSPCLESEWGRKYFARLRHFYEATGMDVLEHDGSYPGDACASSVHPGHRDYGDSQWKQWRQITDFYKWCRARGVYLNVPDWYYLSGSSKCGMGYREGNWSLPRAEQEIIERQNIFDGTWGKTPTMGWMMVPLMEYGGGGAAATIEPLKDHLDHYQRRFANLLGAGVQACYRGPRLYDTDETKAAVKKWVTWFKKYRPILESDIVHGRRADGRDIDWILHVNPTLPIKGMLAVYNPLDEPARRTLNLDLYYTGLTTAVQIREREGAPRSYQLDRRFRVRLDLEVPAHDMTWFVIE